MYVILLKPIKPL